MDSKGTKHLYASLISLICICSNLTLLWIICTTGAQRGALGDPASHSSLCLLTALSLSHSLQFVQDHCCLPGDICVHPKPAILSSLSFTLSLISCCCIHCIPPLLMFHLFYLNVQKGTVKRRREELSTWHFPEAGYKIDILFNSNF